MSGFLACFEKGRPVLDEPTALPEGTVVNLVADDDGDDLTEEERRALARESSRVIKPVHRRTGSFVRHHRPRINIGHRLRVGLE